MLIPTCMIKFIELVLASACLTLHHYSYDLTDLPTLMLCSGTFIGYIVVLSGEIVGEVVSAAADAYVDAWWSASGGMMFGMCGWMILRNWRDVPVSSRRSNAQAEAVCALATAALMTLDALIAVCSAHRDDESRAKSMKTCQQS